MSGGPPGEEEAEPIPEEPVAEPASPTILDDEGVDFPMDTFIGEIIKSL
jgi:hypothetical protein